MSRLSVDAKLFVSGIVDYLKRGKNQGIVVPKVKKLLVKVTKRDDEENKANVESPVALNEAQKREVTKILSKLIGHEVTPVYRINPALLGGIRIQMGGLVIDTSFSNQLSEIIETVR